MGDDSEIRSVLDAEAIRRWARGVVVALEAERDALDRINVYPVADGDTGTNLLHTSRAAWQAVEESSSGVVTDLVQAMATGALEGARGNSGMLLSQVLRGLAEGFRANSGSESAGDPEIVDGTDLRRALGTAVSFARRAVSEPVEGTLLSVMDAAADAVEAVVDPDVSVVACAAVTAAAVALERTPDQLPPLADAGVVDAGGRGLVVLLDVLHSVVHGGRRLAGTLPSATMAVRSRSGDPHESRYAYEVMYLLSGADDSRVAELRDALNAVGDCVSVVEDGIGAWAVHVHCDDIGAAIESGIESGRVYRIRVTRFADQVSTRAQGDSGIHSGAGNCRDGVPSTTGAQGVGQAPVMAGGEEEATTRRVSGIPGSHGETGCAVLACVAGEGLAELFRAEGAAVFLAEAGVPAEAEIGSAIRATHAAHIVVLPNESELTETAERAARETRNSSRDVVVVPTSSPVQGLAALAVHDPSRTRSEDTVAMAEAAAATRRGELAVAEHEALTWAGRCQAGDVLGLVDGDVVLIETDATRAATALADRMLGAGGELVTALAVNEPVSALSGGGQPSMIDALSAHLRRTHPEVEFTYLLCPMAGSVLLLGVE